MSQDARRNIERMIKSRVKTMYKTKHRDAMQRGIDGVTSEFVDKLENLRLTAAKGEVFYMELESLSEELLRQLQKFDPRVSIALDWREDGDERWQSLVLAGVRIDWSEKYLEANADAEPTKYIDVFAMKLSKIFGI